MRAIQPSTVASVFLAGALIAVAVSICANAQPAGASHTFALVQQDDGQKAITGTVKSLDRDARTFVLSSSVDADAVIRCDDRTAFMLDGKMSTLEEVCKVGAKVTATHKDNLASKVEATTPAPEH